MIRIDISTRKKSKSEIAERKEMDKWLKKWRLIGRYGLDIQIGFVDIELNKFIREVRKYEKFRNLVLKSKKNIKLSNLKKFKKQSKKIEKMWNNM